MGGGDVSFNKLPNINIGGSSKPKPVNNEISTYTKSNVAPQGSDVAAAVERKAPPANAPAPTASQEAFKNIY